MRLPTHVKVLLLLLILLLASAVWARSPPKPPQASAGQLHSWVLAMPQLGERQRRVRVYVPAGYGQGQERYPVLYLHDGQFVFGQDPPGGLQLEKLLEPLIASGQLPPLLVVAIDNGPARWDEYSPWRNANMARWIGEGWSAAEEGGEGEAYLRFIVETLKPQIDQRYRTLSEPQHTAIGGASMGGLISIYAGLAYPQVFGRVLAQSTALWFAETGEHWLADNAMLRWMAGRKAAAEQRFYLDMGEREWEQGAPPQIRSGNGDALSWPFIYSDGQRALVAALKASGASDSQLKTVLEAGADHDGKAWAGRMDEALIWLFAP